MLPMVYILKTSLVAHTVKHLPAMRETQVRSLGGEDPWRRKWQPTPVFILAWKIQWEEPGRLQSMRLQRVRTRLSDSTSLHLMVYIL